MSTTSTGTAPACACGDCSPCSRPRCGHPHCGHDGQGYLSNIVGAWWPNGCNACNCFCFLEPGDCVECDGTGIEVRVNPRTEVETKFQCPDCAGTGSVS